MDISTFRAVHDPDTGWVRQTQGELDYYSNGVKKATLDANGNLVSAAGDVIDIGDVAAYTLLAANSGKTHYIPNLTADLTITLPTPAAGLRFYLRYYGVAADAQDWIIDSGANANYFLGGLLHLDADADAAGDEVVPIAGDGNSNSICTILTPNVGTIVEVVCVDGTTWILSGFVVSATVPSFADQA